MHIPQCYEEKTYTLLSSILFLGARNFRVDISTLESRPVPNFEGITLLHPILSKPAMPPIRSTGRNRKAPPEGFDDIEDTLLEFANKMKEARRGAMAHLPNLASA